jgi:large subunit ribosomal protein L24
MHVKKGDKVVVLTGKDKGKSGVVVRALPKENKVVVEGVAIYKKHLRGVGEKSGQIVEKPRAIDASNVRIVTTTKAKSALDEPTKKTEKKKIAK